MFINYFRSIMLILVFFAFATILTGLVYATVQQSLRQSANDPQIQIAEDIATQLDNGRDASSLDSQNKTDIAKGLGPYIIIYDDQGKPLASTALLDGQIPVVPFGVLQNAKVHGENRVTWQPQAQVRSAIVAVPFTGKQSGYVVAGRSLRETEIREHFVFKAALLSWLLLLAVTTSTACLMLFVNPVRDSDGLITSETSRISNGINKKLND